MESGSTNNQTNGKSVNSDKSSDEESRDSIGYNVTSSSNSNQSQHSLADDRGLENRKRAIWDEMRMRMESRRKDWNVEVERLRKDFFQPKAVGGLSSPTLETGQCKTLERLNSNTSEESNKFRVSFDLSLFHPKEISVKAEEQKLVVSARHEEKSPDGKRTAAREFNRQIDIPKNVHPGTMRCTLSKDGVLQVEADVVKRRSSLESSTNPGVLLQKISSWTPRAHTPTQKPTAAQPTTFTISINIGRDFSPEDLAVQTVDRKLVVSARRHLERPGNTTMREFHREFDLPDGVDPVTVTANMTDEGLLLIEAPLHSSNKSLDSVGEDQ